MVNEETKIEILGNMWIMMIGAFIIILCNTFDYFAKNTPAFIFIACVYLIIGLFIYLLYNPFRRIKNWRKDTKQ